MAPAYRSDALLTELRCHGQIRNFNPYGPQISNSFHRFLPFMWTFLSTCFVNSISYECPQLILLLT